MWLEVLFLLTLHTICPQKISSTVPTLSFWLTSELSMASSVEDPAARTLLTPLSNNPMAAPTPNSISSMYDHVLGRDAAPNEGSSEEPQCGNQTKPYLPAELLDMICDPLSKPDLLNFACVSKIFNTVARRRLQRMVPLRLGFGYKGPEPCAPQITQEAWENIRSVEFRLNMTRSSQCNYSIK